MAENVKGGGPAPYYQPAMRELVARGDPAEMDLLLREARIIRERFGDLDAAITDLEAALKRHG